MVDENRTRFEAAYFEAVRTMLVRLTTGGTGKKFTLPEVNQRINELLKHSIQSEGVINLFSDVGTEFSLFDPKFLEEIAGMKEKNLAVELLKKLIAEQVSIYRRTNLVKSEKFSEIIQSAMNRYLNGMLTNEEVIQELLKLAKEISNAHAEGEKLGLTAEELAFYDAITKPQAIKDFYERDELIAITRELTDLLRKNRTIDWQKKESARAGMRRLVKRLLKKHKYPPEGMEDAVQTVYEPVRDVDGCNGGISLDLQFSEVFSCPGSKKKDEYSSSAEVTRLHSTRQSVATVSTGKKQSYSFMYALCKRFSCARGVFSIPDQLCCHIVNKGRRSQAGIHMLFMQMAPISS